MLDQRHEAILDRHYSTPVDLSGRLTLSVTARTAPQGNQAGGTNAKLYVRTGPNCAWYDDKGQSGA